MLQHRQPAGCVVYDSGGSHLAATPLPMHRRDGRAGRRCCGGGARARRLLLLLLLLAWLHALAAGGSRQRRAAEHLRGREHLQQGQAERGWAGPVALLCLVSLPAAAAAAVLVRARVQQRVHPQLAAGMARQQHSGVAPEQVGAHSGDGRGRACGHTAMGRSRRSRRRSPLPVGGSSPASPALLTAPIHPAMPTCVVLRNQPAGGGAQQVQAAGGIADGQEARRSGGAGGGHIVQRRCRLAQLQHRHRLSVVAPCFGAAEQGGHSGQLAAATCSSAAAAGGSDGRGRQ